MLWHVGYTGDKEKLGCGCGTENVARVVCDGWAEICSHRH